MATTESRTGFRLPWSADRASSREGFEGNPGTDSSAPLGGPDGSDGSAQDAPDATRTPDAGAPGGAEADPALTVVDPPDGTPAPRTTDAEGAPTAAPVADPPPPHHAGSTRRPTKFLIDLTHAMQVAAEQARAATLEQFRVDGTAYVEQIQGHSVADDGVLRARADEDVTRIKDWSKAEIARIREETEARIAGRRGQLDDQLARHRALVERDVARIEEQIATFEAQMAAFFDELLAETDLTVLAARAQQMPEAPTFDEPDETAFSALMTEPGVGIPVPAPAAEREPVASAAPEPAVATTPPGADPTSGSAMGQPGDDDVPDVAEPTSDEVAFAREAALAAIRAAAQTAAALESEATVSPEAAGETVPGDGAAEPDVAPDGAPPSVPANAWQDSDPRLAMLGLTPDFAAAEIAAAEAAAAELQEIPEMDEKDLTARLAGLVPSSASGTPADGSPSLPLVSTQVIVSGLVSVASIASFKRHLSRVAGVHHVGVSSGPDGEFLFTVQHEGGATLRDLIPTLPGFQARVTGGSNGIVTASAQDPED